MNREPFVIERTYNASPERIWRAISDRDEMSKWYFNLEEFRPEVGFEFRFWGGPEHKQYLHICEVTEAVPNMKLTYSWRYDGYEGISYVTWELFPEGDQTRLKLTHIGLETFPPEPDFARSNFEAGWTYIIGESLVKYLA